MTDLLGDHGRQRPVLGGIDAARFGSRAVEPLVEQSQVGLLAEHALQGAINQRLGHCP